MDVRKLRKDIATWCYIAAALMVAEPKFRERLTEPREAGRKFRELLHEALDAASDASKARSLVARLTDNERRLIWLALFLGSQRAQPDLAEPSSPLFSHMNRVLRFNYHKPPLTNANEVQLYLDTSLGSLRRGLIRPSGCFGISLHPCMVCWVHRQPG